MAIRLLGHYNFDKNLSNLKVIDILKHDYLKLQNQYKNIFVVFDREL